MSILLWQSVILFQVGWFLLVLGHQSNLYLLSLFIIAFYLFAERRNAVKPPSKTVYFFRTTLLLIGCLVDWSFAKLGWIEFSSTSLLPFWLVLIWVLFAITFDDCFGWLKNKLTLAFSLGAIFGPAAYWSVSSISDVKVISPVQFTIVSMCFWGLIFFFYASFKTRFYYMSD